VSRRCGDALQTLFLLLLLSLLLLLLLSPYLCLALQSITQRTNSPLEVYSSVTVQ
jgi:hypothetical protein